MHATRVSDVGTPTPPIHSLKKLFIIIRNKSHLYIEDCGLAETRLATDRAVYNKEKKYRTENSKYKYGFPI
jgi:hypothetical protein